METAAFDPRAIDAAAVRRELGFSPEDVVVGTVARLFVNKGYEQLLDVMSLAVARESYCSQSSGTQPHCSQSSGTLKFLWVGDGADRGRYEAELRRRGLRERTVLTGLLPPDQMPRVLAAMNILAHTSQWEGLPRAVVQALLMERPAVSFDIDGAPEVVKPGETGELAALGDVDGFAEAVLRLAADAELRRAHGRRGRERCLAEFDHRLMVERLEQVYASAGRRRRPE
jgi:glycosyltransferase involved in cell wall biosynthesis